MRVARIIVGAWFTIVLGLGVQLLTGTGGPGSNGPRSAAAAEVADPGDYHLSVDCITAAGGAHRCRFVTSVDNDDQPVQSFVVPAAVLCADVIDGEDFTTLGDGSLLFAGSSGWLDLAAAATVDDAQTVTYTLNAGAESDDPVPVTVAGPALACEADLPAATIDLAVAANRADNNNLLPDACFAIYQQVADTRTLVADATCDGDDGLADGTTHFSSLPADTTLVIVETAAPDGYQLADEQTVQVGELSLRVLVPHERLPLPPTTEVDIYALYCETDPGSFDIEAMAHDVVPDGCRQATGVAYDVTEDGKPASEGRLTTGRDGTTRVTVPTGAAVVIRQIPQTLLPGFSPVTNPIDLGSVDGDRVNVLFLNLRGPEPSSSPNPSPNPSANPSPDPSSSPSPSASPSPGDGTSPSPSPSQSPAPSPSVSPGGTTQPSPSPSPSVGANAGGAPRSTAVAVTELPATGSGEPAPMQSNLPWLAVTLAAVVASAGVWRRRGQHRA